MWSVKSKEGKSFRCAVRKQAPSSESAASPLQPGLSFVGSYLSIVLDNSRESDDLNFRISGRKVLPQVLRWQQLTGFVNPHVPEQTGTGSHQRTQSGSTPVQVTLSCLPVQVTLLLPFSLDVFLGVSREVLVAGFCEQAHFLQGASKSPPTVVEVPLIRSHVGSGCRPPLVV